jgi:hypothetical protein
MKYLAKNIEFYCKNYGHKVFSINPDFVNADTLNQLRRQLLSYNRDINNIYCITFDLYQEIEIRGKKYKIIFHKNLKLTRGI